MTISKIRKENIFNTNYKIDSKNTLRFVERGINRFNCDLNCHPLDIVGVTLPIKFGFRFLALQI